MSRVCASYARAGPGVGCGKKRGAPCQSLAPIAAVSRPRATFTGSRCIGHRAVRGRALRLGPLALLFGRLQRFFNGIISRQDTPDVETQPASETRLREMNEILVPSDEPIIAYRRWREAHRGQGPSAGSLRCTHNLVPQHDIPLVNHRNAGVVNRVAEPAERAGTERKVSRAGDW